MWMLHEAKIQLLKLVVYEKLFMGTAILYSNKVFNVFTHAVDLVQNQMKTFDDFLKIYKFLYGIKIV
jgi:hypothetical protein